MKKVMMIVFSITVLGCGSLFADKRKKSRFMGIKTVREGRGKYAHFGSAIEQDDYQKVKDTFEKLRNENETDESLRARIKESGYYKSGANKKKRGGWAHLSEKRKYGSPVQQAASPTDQNGNALQPRSNALRALKELGFY